jgi:beta-lactamase class A
MAAFQLVDALLTAHDTNDRINHYLIRAVPAEVWNLKPPKGRDVWHVGVGNSLRTGLVLFAWAVLLHGQTSWIDTVASKTLSNFAPALKPAELALTVIDLQDGSTHSYRGDAPIYPASVVKLFYLVAAHAQMESGVLKDTPELERALHDMIVDSSNDATGMVLDSLTGTTGGPELPPDELAKWMDKRNAVNRYFAGLGYTGINVNQKAFAEGPYGRERQARGPNFENNNRLTTDATARLLRSIVEHKAVTPARSDAMLALLHRDIDGPTKDPDDQAHGFSSKALPPGSQYFSKAGWTSTTRHDATYVVLPNGSRYIAVIFTVNNAKNPAILPFVSKLLVEHF